MKRITTKQQLLDSLATARPQLEAFLGSLSPGQLAEPRDLGGWAVKDHLAHLAVWQNGMTALLQYQSRWDAMGVPMAFATDHTDDEINAIIFELHKDKAPEDVLAMFRASRDTFVAIIGRLSDDDLRQTYSHYQPNEPGEDSGAPILNWVAGNASLHVLEHLPWMQQIVSPSLALVRRWAEAWSRSDVEAMDALFAADYAVNGERIGPTGVKQAVRDLRAAFSPAALTLDEVVTAGDKVAVRWTVRGTHSGDFIGLAPTGRPVALSGINLYRIADGRIAENHEQVGVEALLRQLRA